jgi:hypothetical protein
MRIRIARKTARVGGVAALMAGAVAAPAFANNLLTNPGFESPPDPGVQNDTEASGWTFIPLGCARATYYNHTPGGTESIWLQTYDPIGGGIYQDVPDVVAGTTYQLSAYFLFESAYTDTSTTLDMQMIFEDSGGNQLSDQEILIQPTDPIPSNPALVGVWNLFTTPSTIAPAGTAQIQVEFDCGPGATVPGQQSAFVDDADLSGIGPPPPANGWQTNGTGDWNVSGNWSQGSVPNGAGNEADFFGIITSPRTVVIDSNPSAGFTGDTVGILHFNNSNTYAIAGTGTLTIEGVSGTAGLIQVDQASDDLELPVTIASNTTLNVATGANLLVANTFTIDAGDAVTQTGGGTVTYQSIVTLGAGASLQIANSTFGNTLALGTNSKVSIAPSTGTPSTVQFNNLSLASGAQLDVGNGTFDVNFGSGTDPASTIRSELTSGFNAKGTKWTGAGITSSLAAANPSEFAVGYADGGNAIDRANTGVAAGTVEIKYTVAGDANLSGGVDLSDLVIVASDFGDSGADWAEGDVNYDGNVDLSDLVIVASNFGASLSSVNATGFSASFASEWQLALSEVKGADVAVPEPASLGALSLLGLSALHRRRRIIRA